MLANEKRVMVVVMVLLGPKEREKSREVGGAWST